SLPITEPSSLNKSWYLPPVLSVLIRIRYSPAETSWPACRAPSLPAAFSGSHTAVLSAVAVDSLAGSSISSALSVLPKLETPNVAVTSGSASGSISEGGKNCACTALPSSAVSSKRQSLSASLSSSTQRK